MKAPEADEARRDGLPADLAAKPAVDLHRQRDSLREVIEEISSQLELRPLLTSIVRHACELLDAHDGSIGLYDEAKDVFRIEAIYRMPTSEIGAEMRRGIGLAGLVLETRRPVVLARYDEVPQPTLPELAANAVLGMPIFWRDRLIGFFGIGARPPRKFSDHDVEALGLFGRHAAIAIENARLYERAHQTAVLEERQRLARDLHDSVMQKLFSLTLIGQALIPAWRRDPAEGEKRTARLVELSGEALGEMRVLLRELRPASAEERLAAPVSHLLPYGLAAALGDLARAARNDCGKVEFVLRGYRTQEPTVEENLYRFCQEALANVAKHSQAQEVTILLAQEQRRIELKVIDDGVGFDAAAWWARGTAERQDGSGFGLVGMRERAAALGGRFRLASRPGGGTIVEVVLRTLGE